MGKKLIIKGADFSADAIPEPNIVWNDEFVNPNSGDAYFVCGGANNVIGPYYKQGAVVDGIKLSLKPKIPIPGNYAAGARNLQVGDVLVFSKVSISSPFNKTTLVEVTLTQSDFDNGFIIVRFDQQQQLTSTEFLGIGKRSDDSSVLVIPCTHKMSSGIATKWINSVGTSINNTTSSGIATYYIEE